MKRVLVTGGTGELGRNLVDPLLRADYTVRVMSRKSPEVSRRPDVEWTQADLATGDGLHEAVADVDTIIHAATNAGVTYDNVTMSAFVRKALLRHDDSVDVQGTKRLLEQARTAGVRHCIYISIVGIEHIPFAYYRHKLEAENLVRESGIPWTIARATQFYSLIDTLIGMSAKWPVAALATDFRLQPNDPGDFAKQLCAAVVQGPAGRLPDFGGPEVLTLGDMARSWLDVQGMGKRIIRMPLPGKAAGELRQGALTCRDGLRGTITWQEWLERAYTRPARATAAAQH